MDKEIKNKIEECLKEGWYSWEDDECIYIDDLDIYLEVRV